MSDYLLLEKPPNADLLGPPKNSQLICSDSQRYNKLADMSQASFIGLTHTIVQFVYNNTCRLFSQRYQ